MKNFKKILLIIGLQLIIGADVTVDDAALTHPWSQFTNRGGSLSRIGDFTYPTNPMNDRAIGFLLKGKAKSAVTNYGEFIEWDVHPAGLWGNYTYLPAVGFVAGIPGQSYSYNYNWTNYEESGGTCPEANGNFVIWCSNDAYLDPNETNPNFSWIEHGDTNFVSVVFESAEDRGVLGQALLSPSEAGEFEISCDLALETIMACGIGICQGCSVEKKVLSSSEHTYRNGYSLACIDGPIFSSKDIIRCE